MSSIEDITAARKEIEEILKNLVALDENLLGAMIVDEEGLPLTYYSKQEEGASDVGPEEEETLGGTIIDAFSKVSELIREDRLNLGELKRFMVEGSKGIAILYPIKSINGILLLYGKNNVKVGFIWTILGEIEEKLGNLAKIAYSV